MKKIKVDKSGKSEALFLLDKIPVVNKKDLAILISKKKNIRFCLHKSKKSKLHCMVNLINKNNNIRMHKHLKDEAYCILKGKLLITVKNNKNIKKIILNNSNNKIAFIPKNVFHSIQSLNNYSIFFETSVGPFSKKNLIYEKKT